ncbi:MAG: hypothetical protein WC222_08450 [Parachlamydiales bacterium]|jgi:hypothetical protein
MSSKRLFALFDFYTIKDVFGVWRRAWKSILLGTIAFGTFGAYWSLSENVRYSAEASFREKNHPRGGIASSSLTAILLSQGGDGADSSAVSTMKSRSMMEKLIRLENLQGKISTDEQSKSLWDLMADNLRVEYALFMGGKEPIIPDSVKPLLIKEISYDGELIRGFKIRFIDENTYTIKGASFEAGGTLGKPFKYEDISFVLEKANSEPLSGKSFNLALLPLALTAQDLSKLVVITTDRDDGTMLRIRFRADNRHLAVRYVNRLMSLYQEFIENEHKQMLSTQLNYLQKRQNEVYTTLQDKMHHYADTLSEDFTNLGFTDTERAMEFLAANQHAFKTKQLAISMEVQRLETVQKEGKKILDSLSGVIDSPHLNKLLNDIRELKQQYDAIHVAFSSATNNRSKDYKDNFEANLTALAALAEAKQDAHDLIALLETGAVPEFIPESLTHPDYMVDAWQLKLEEDPSPEMRSKYLNYLTNLKHHLQVYSKTLEENLSHHQSLTPELQGINLNIANEMFLSYSKEVNNIEGQALQYEFIIEQLQKPEFELSSLSAIINDPISREISNNASTLALALNDRSNRTDKEIFRLQEELKLQRKFLVLHLKQAKELLEIKMGLLLDKIQAIRQTTLSIIQQNVGVAENQIHEQIKTRLANLKQELALIDRQQSDLHKQMALLPKKWVSEQLINQHMEMHRQMSREITNLVESKNISSNLEIMQSAPVDIAIPPLHPDSPRFLMFTLLGTFVGLFFMVSGTLIRAIGKGVPASDESLRLVGLQVAGSMTEPQTVERAAAMVLLNSKPGLLQQSILVVEKDSQRNAMKIFRFLESQGKNPVLIEWNDPLPTNHPWVVAYTTLSPADPEILVRHAHFDHFVVIVNKESLGQLEPLIERVQENKENLYTIFITY